MSNRHAYRRMKIYRCSKVEVALEIQIPLERSKATS